ncbi:uncharacterized protein [Watersipora subatra]|uniref:uncharacterized protein isoform X2 n=1 Tax=Watersipora subatra TaxID=2589382 RepID=UPI00355B5188
MGIRNSCLAKTIIILLEIVKIGVVVASGKVNETIPGCVARVQTDTGIKWISLEDDYTLSKDTAYQYEAKDYDVILLWRPCVPFNVTLPPSVKSFENTCHNTYSARKNHNRTCIGLGSVPHFSVVDGGVEIAYSVHDDPNLSTKVQLVCNMTVEKGNLLCDKDCGSNSLVLKFSSKYVCLRDSPNSLIPVPHSRVEPGLGIGSLILIVAGSILLVYLLVGIIHGSLLGRSGCDRLPNSDFWMELPYLVKDGCRFTFMCRTPRPVYGRRKRKKDIYQPIIYDNNIPIVDV